MGVRLSPEEAWDFLATAHTGIFTSLRRDGWPVSLPVWFAVLDGALYLRTPARAKKLARIRKDDRVSFVAESGEAWKELKGVVVTGRASIVEDDAEVGRAEAALDAKYAAFRTPRSAMPEASKKHYAASVWIRVEPVQDFLTWDNAKLRQRSGGG